MGLIEDVMSGFMNDRDKKTQTKDVTSTSGYNQNTAIVGTSFSGSSKISEEEALSISSDILLEPLKDVPTMAVF